MAATGGRPLTDRISSNDAEATRGDAKAADSPESSHTVTMPRTSGRPAPSRSTVQRALDLTGDGGQEGRLKTLPPTAGELAETTTFRETLVAARRFGATLNGLLSAVDVFARGVEGARAANDALLKRLDGMKEQVNSAEERSQSLQEQVAQLKAELASKEAAFAVERQFLTDEQDEFLAALLEEHEEELRSALQQNALKNGALAQGAQASADAPEGSETLQSLRDKVDNLRVERERARELVQRMRSQRDGAQAELRRRQESADDAPKTLPPSGVAHPTTPAPPPFAQVSRAPGSVRADADRDAAMLQNLGVVRLPRLSPPPAELAGALQHGSNVPRPTYGAQTSSHMPSQHVPTARRADGAAPPSAAASTGPKTIGGIGGMQAPRPPISSRIEPTTERPARPATSHAPLGPSHGPRPTSQTALGIGSKAGSPEAAAVPPTSRNPLTSRGPKPYSVLSTPPPRSPLPEAPRTPDDLGLDGLGLSLDLTPPAPGSSAPLPVSQTSKKDGLPADEAPSRVPQKV
jgi:hypothetical protein